ncbi:uncharacterized protein LOC125233824 [Leguminivora glycinivorella]|uniref:uncharacterized protein LOC125233824 n=1 Tax=Leguminivora glycinivorella TaxID=1035111 RepID=UPI00200C2E51|nr:uncharacterized protein LOC125233824 [Leguminivora glycinivorella]
MLVSAVVSESYNHSVGFSESKVLSRRKRFLVYPEGSSLQLVFCLSFPTIFDIGDIFQFGYTAALAYELPQDPYSPAMHHADPLHRRVDTKMIYFTDDKGKVLWGKEYHRKPLVNPAMAKRSLKTPDRRRMHASQHTRRFLKNVDGRAEFHRTARAKLYPKIETVLQAIGSNGRDCVLRTLCRVGQTQHQPQGSFLDEIMRAVFTLPKGSYSFDLEEYDRAHSATESCAELYPDCEDSAA